MTRRLLRVDEDSIVELRARASVWARVLPAPAHDEELGLARLDLDILREIGVEPGEWIFLRTNESRPARRVTLRRLERPSKSSREVGSGSFLEGRTLIVGDVVHVGVETDQHAEEAHASIAGLRLVTVDIRGAGLEPATARVDNTDPEGPVQVVESTTIDLLTDDNGMG